MGKTEIKLKDNTEFNKLMKQLNRVKLKDNTEFNKLMKQLNRIEFIIKALVDKAKGKGYLEI
jgi:hypothetical protein